MIRLQAGTLTSRSLLRPLAQSACDAAMPFPTVARNTTAAMPATLRQRLPRALKVDGAFDALFIVSGFRNFAPSSSLTKNINSVERDLPLSSQRDLAVR